MCARSLDRLVGRPVLGHDPQEQTQAPLRRARDHARRERVHNERQTRLGRITRLRNNNIDLSTSRAISNRPRMSSNRLVSLLAPLLGHVLSLVRVLHNSPTAFALSQLPTTHRPPPLTAYFYSLLFVRSPPLGCLVRLLSHHIRYRHPTGHSRDPTCHANHASPHTRSVRSRLSPSPSRARGHCLQSSIPIQNIN